MDEQSLVSLDNVKEQCFICIRKRFEYIGIVETQVVGLDAERLPWFFYLELKIDPLIRL